MPGSVLNSDEPFGLAQIGDTVQNLIPQIERVLDKLSLNLDQLQNTLVDAGDLLNDRNRANLGQALARANDLMNDGNRAKLSESLDSVHRMARDAEPKVSTTLTRLGDATGRLNPLLDDFSKTATRADELLSRLDSVVSENRPNLRATTTELPAAVMELRDVLTKSTAVIEQLQGIMDQNTVNIDEILENLRESTQNLRSLTEAVKSNPATLIRGVSAKDRNPGDIGK
jgi:division protein CdvB (Snf7/Vps24/ESCRT-III family)